MAEPVALPVREAYRLWAPSYDRENALTALEARVVAEVSPRTTGRSLLDAGCGTGRRMARAPGAPRRAVGIDLVPEMLRAAATDPGGALRTAADVRALPFPAATFDLLWLRLVAGHLPALEDAYRELGRVASGGAALVVSDFHPEAVAAGHRRTFRDEAGRIRAVEHHVHTVGDHERVARGTGWTIDRLVEAPAGEAERAYYARAGRLEQLERERALPLILVVCLRR